MTPVGTPTVARRAVPWDNDTARKYCLLYGLKRMVSEDTNRQLETESGTVNVRVSGASYHYVATYTPQTMARLNGSQRDKILPSSSPSAS